MPSDKEVRKLAAIMHADVKGRSRLIGEDESYTLRALKECLQLFVEKIGSYAMKFSIFYGQEIQKMLMPA